MRDDDDYYDYDYSRVGASKAVYVSPLRPTLNPKPQPRNSKCLKAKAVEGCAAAAFAVFKFGFGASRSAMNFIWGAGLGLRAA